MLVPFAAHLTSTFVSKCILRFKPVKWGQFPLTKYLQPWAVIPLPDIVKQYTQKQSNKFYPLSFA